MKAMIVNNYGNTDVFNATNIDKPAVTAGKVLVKIAATSINTVDTMIRSMGHELPLSPELPAVLGMDFAGTVEATGDGITQFNIGDEVYGCAGGLIGLPGALAEYILADAKLVAHKPKSISMREAAALPLVGITAYEGLVRSGIHEGQKVLVHGGAGGVGHIATQLASHWGAEVYATIGREEHAELVNQLGASPINYRTETVSEYVDKYTNGAGFDVVFDSVGGENMLNSFEAAALNANVASTVAMVNIDLSLVHFKGLSLHVIFMLIPMLHDHHREEHGKILTALADIVDAGQLSIILDNTNYQLEDVGKAHERLESGKATGKVVVSVS